MTTSTRHVRRDDTAARAKARDIVRYCDVYHVLTGNRGVVNGFQGGCVAVRIKGEGITRFWRVEDCIKLPAKVPANAEEIKTCAALDITIRQLRKARA
jgi:hypothetical protein